MIGIRKYPVELGAKDVLTGMYDAFEYDDDGIPMYRYASGLHYNITFICHQALYGLSRYQLSGDRALLSRFLMVADWVLGRGKETDQGFVFPYTMSFPMLPPPWISALGQGRMISVLTRAWEATGREVYLETAERALHPFLIPVENGGVQTAFPKGGIAFEEYPRSVPNVVLNGLITSLFGVHDLAVCGVERAAELFDSATQSLADNLDRYDLGYWSAYDLTGPIRRVASDEYHTYHVQLLWALFELTGIEAFRARAVSWNDYRGGVRLAVGRSLSRINTRIKYRDR